MHTVYLQNVLLGIYNEKDKDEICTFNKICMTVTDARFCCTLRGDKQRSLPTAVQQADTRGPDREIIYNVAQPNMGTELNLQFNLAENNRENQLNKQGLI